LSRYETTLVDYIIAEKKGGIPQTKALFGVVSG
jgi:hypothetical protein